MRRFLVLVSVSLTSTLALNGLLGCASNPWPGEERVGGGREFDPDDPMPQAPKEQAPTAPKKDEPPKKFTKAYAESYNRPKSRYPDLATLYALRQKTCAAGKPAPSSILAKGDVKMDTAAGTRVGSAVLFYESPNKLAHRLTVAEDRESIAYGEAEVLRQGFDGKRGWQSDHTGTFFLDEALAHLVELEVENLFENWSTLYPESDTADQLDLNGAPVYRVDVKSRLGEKFRMYIHRDTGVLVRLEHVDPEDPTTIMSTVDYINVGARGGFCFPNRISFRWSDDRRDIDIKSVVANPPKPPSTKLPKELEGVGDL